MTNKRSRKSIFELERRRNLTDDIANVTNDFNNYIVTDLKCTRCTIMQYLDKSIQGWPYRQGETSIDDFFAQHGIDSKDSDDTTALLKAKLYINLLHWAQIFEANLGGLKFNFGESEDSVSRVCNRYLENIVFSWNRATILFERLRKKMIITLSI